MRVILIFSIDGIGILDATVAILDLALSKQKHQVQTNIVSVYRSLVLFAMTCECAAIRCHRLARLA